MNALNIKIIVFVMAINLFYFNHDFGVTNDLIKFILVMVANVYIVKALYDLYLFFKDKYNPEVVAIILYGVGVLVQSYFIHNYINIEFDKVILSSYFMIASALGILIGFNNGWSITRKIGLGAIYYSLAKFFIYDFYTQDFSTTVRMVTYFILGFTLLGISFLYSYLEKKFGNDKEVVNNPFNA